jgi:type IV pilus assembly protein PilB
MSGGRRRRLGELLQEAGLITQVQLNAALAEQRQWGGRLGRTLVEMGFVDEASMATALSGQLQLPMVDLDAQEIAPEVLEFLRVDLAERYGVFPLFGDRRKKELHLASADPTNGESIQELSFTLGMRVQVAVATPSAIDRAIRHYYYGESVVASPTATPAQLGVSEPVFELDEPTAPAVAPRPEPALRAELAEVSSRLAELEGLMAHQARAMRVMLDLMAERGLFLRDEYLARLRGE